MNKYSIKYVQANLSKLLEVVPFQITKHGKVIAVVNGYTAGERVYNRSSTKLSTNIYLCKHGSKYWLFRYGCGE